MTLRLSEQCFKEEKWKVGGERMRANLSPYFSAGLFIVREINDLVKDRQSKILFIPYRDSVGLWIEDFECDWNSRRSNVHTLSNLVIESFCCWIQWQRWINKISTSLFTSRFVNIFLGSELWSKPNGLLCFDNSILTLFQLLKEIETV